MAIDLALDHTAASRRDNHRSSSRTEPAGPLHNNFKSPEMSAADNAVDVILSTRCYKDYLTHDMIASLIAFLTVCEHEDHKRCIGTLSR